MEFLSHTAKNKQILLSVSVLPTYSFFPPSSETIHGHRLVREHLSITGKEEGDAIRHLFQRLGVLLVKGNAALMLNRIPSFPLPEIDGDL